MFAGRGTRDAAQTIMSVLIGIFLVEGLGFSQSQMGVLLGISLAGGLVLSFGIMFIGARIARKVAPRLGLNKNECETVEWLVRYHLLMSDMAQKRDIADPRTIRDFAKAVKTQKRLDLLIVLTTCLSYGAAATGLFAIAKIAL